MDIKKRLAAFFLAMSMMVGMIPVVTFPTIAKAAEETVKEDAPLRLLYDEEAPYSQENTYFGDGGAPNDPNDGWERWSIPLGNGYFGANVFGRTDTERIQLTEKTLCNPYSSSTNNAGGLNNFSETYLDFGHAFDSVTDYSRELDLETAVSSVSYVYDGVTYEREYFTSYEDYCMVIKLTADTEGKLDFTLRPTIPYLQDFVWNNNNTAQGRLDGITKHGKVVSSVTADEAIINLYGNMGEYNVDFEAEYRVFTDGNVAAGSWTHTYNTCVDSSVADEYDSGVRDDAAQTLTVTNGTLEISNATEAYIVVCLGTNYDQSKGAGNSSIYTTGSNANKLDEAGVDAKAANGARMAQALANSFDKADTIAQGYEALRARHVADYSELFGRVSFNLAIDEADLTLTTDKLLENYKNDEGNGHYLEMLYYQYGRYLLIASSRETTLPANLQGTWNRYNYAPWGSGYWHNVNEQMNYWPAFSTNLAETFEAYVNFEEAYMAQAQRNAQIELSRAPFNYTGNNTGFTLGIGVTPYVVGSSASCGELGFTTQLFWEYYSYTEDLEILKDIVYPILYEAAEFITKTVAYNESEDAYLSIYSYSPEQFNGGTSWYYTEGTPYAQSFAYLNNVHLLKAAEILGVEDDSLLSEVRRQIDKYDAILVGYSGQIKEFREEDYYGDIGEYSHRHISHLVGLYPGEMINANTPAWLDAAIVTLTERGDKATGWGVAHRLNLWAHTKNGDRTYKLLEQLLKSNTATNLWDLHHPFQVDGNFGGTSGITEMLLQSHEGYIEPLAAIPSSWTDGAYDGLVARGNFVVGADWTNGSLTDTEITSINGGKVKVKAQNIASATVKTAGGSSVSVAADGKDYISFDTVAGETYKISGIPARVTVTPVSELAVEQTSENAFTLSWIGSPDAVSYNVYKAVEDAPDYTLLGNTAECTYTYTILAEEENARVTYRVTAVNADGRESTGELVYVNPGQVSIFATQAATLADGGLQVVVEASENAESYTLYKYDSATSEWSEVATSDYPVIVYADYSSSEKYAVTARAGYSVSEFCEITLSQGGAGLIEDPDFNIFTGTTAAMVELSGTGVYGGFPAINCFDGDVNTRMAPVDKQDVPYYLTVTLASTYDVKTIRIYDFRSWGETGTRSDKTAIEVYNDGAWTTIISNARLDRVDGKTYCEFDLGFAKAEKIRFTFHNTQAASSASIFEITGTAAKPSLADRTELLSAVEAADQMDISGYDVASATRFSVALNNAKATLASIQLGQEAMDSAAETLNDVMKNVPTGEDLDLNVTEDLYDGSIPLAFDNINLPSAGGVGGKAEDDLAYYMADARKYTFNLYRDSSMYAEDYTVEFSVLLENLAQFALYSKTIVSYSNGTLGSDGWNNGPQIKMADGMIYVANAKLIAIDGSPVSGGVTLCEYNANEWYKFAIVIPVTKGELVNIIDVVINGVKYTLSLTNPFYGLSYVQLEKMNATSDRVYFDNIVNRMGEDAVYYTHRDMPNNLDGADADKLTVKDSVIKMNDLYTAGDLKQIVGDDIRVFTSDDFTSQLSDSEYFNGDEIVVSFAKNGRDYERVYRYFTVELPEIRSNVTTFDAEDDGYPFNEAAFATVVNGAFGNPRNAFMSETAGKATYMKPQYFGPTAGNDWTVEFTVLAEADSQISFYTKYTDSAFGFSLYFGKGSIWLNKASAVSGGSSYMSGNNATLGAMNAGEWYRVAIVFPCDSTDYGNTVYIYINGVKYTVTLTYEFNNIKYTCFQQKSGKCYLDDLSVRDETIATYRGSLDTPPAFSSDDGRVGVSGSEIKLGLPLTVLQLKEILGNNITVLRDASVLASDAKIEEGDRIALPPTNGRAYGYATAKVIAPKIYEFNAEDGGYPFNEAAFATIAGGVYGNPGNAFMASTAGKSTYTKYQYYGPSAGNDWTVEFTVLAEADSQISFYTKYTDSAFGFSLYMGNGAITVSKVNAVSGGSSYTSGGNATLCTMNVGEWYRVAIVFPCDATAYGNTVYIYVNGVKYTVTLTYEFNNIKYTCFQHRTGTCYLDDLVFTDSAYADYDVMGAKAPEISNAESITVNDGEISLYGGFTVSQLESVLGLNIAVLDGERTLGDDEVIAAGNKLVVLPTDDSYGYGYYTVLENTELDETYSGQIDSVVWTVNVTQGTLTLTGTGAVNSNPAPWAEYASSITTVTVGEGITSLGTYAFKDLTSVTTIDLPDSLLSVGYGAFYGCSAVETLELSEKVYNISAAAFNGCTSLKSVNIPEKVTVINANLFTNCKALESITIPGSVTSIGKSAFNGCSALTTVNFNEGLTTIDQYAFLGCSSLDNVVLPSTVNVIGQQAFIRCSALTSIVIPEGVLGLGYSTFAGCAKLESVTLPGSLTSIGKAVFSECKALKEIDIPDSVTSIDTHAFLSCSYLEKVTIGDKVVSVGNFAFHGCIRMNDLTIGESVETLGQYAFYGCGSLESITLPDSVKSVGMYALANNLTTVPEPKLAEVNFGAGLTTVGYGAFANQTALERVILPDNNPITLANSVFYNCTALKYADMGSTATVGSSAFSGCTALETVVIRESLTALSDLMLYNCKSITTIAYLGTAEQWTALVDAATAANARWAFGVGEYTLTHELPEIE